MKTVRLVASILLVCLALLSWVVAQTSQGRILGLVTDSSGAVIGGAKVTISNTATGISRSLTTTAARDYNAPILSRVRIQ